MVDNNVIFLFMYTFLLMTKKKLAQGVRHAFFNITKIAVNVLVTRRCCTCIIFPNLLIIYGAPFMTCKTTTLNILPPAPSSGQILNYIVKFFLILSRIRRFVYIRFTSTWLFLFICFIEVILSKWTLNKKLCVHIFQGIYSEKLTVTYKQLSAVLTNPLFFSMGLTVLSSSVSSKRTQMGYLFLQVNKVV